MFLSCLSVCACVHTYDRADTSLDPPTGLTSTSSLFYFLLYIFYVYQLWLIKVCDVCWLTTTVSILNVYVFYVLHPSGVAKTEYQLNLAGVRTGMSPLPGGRQHCVIPFAMWVPVAVRRFYYLPYPVTLLCFTSTLLNSVDHHLHRVYLFT